MNKLFNYKIVNLNNNIKVGFSLNNIDIILSKFKELNINYIIIKDKSVVNKYECNNNCFGKYTSSVFDIISINNRISRIVDKLKNIENNKIDDVLNKIECLID